MEHDAAPCARPAYRGLLLFQSARREHDLPPDGRAAAGASGMDGQRTGDHVSRMVDSRCCRYQQLHVHLGYGGREPRLWRYGQDQIYRNALTIKICHATFNDVRGKYLLALTSLNDRKLKQKCLVIYIFGKDFTMSSMITADTIRKILSDNINKEYSFSREEAIAIMNLPEEDMPFLMEMAGSLRKKYKGNHVSIHLLTNARSGNCSQNCAYCAQSCRSKADIEKYKWVDDEKLYSDNAFVHDNHLSRHCIGLSGMKFTDEDIEELAEKIRVMKADGTHLCCSIGFLTEKQALILKEAGLDRINHNLNSSRSYYHNICTTHTYEQRVNNIHMLQRLGFEICSGGIIGMGESKEDIVDMLLDLREIQPEALPINFLLPIPGTPLEHADTTVLTPSYCMKVLCLARLLVPQSDIRCAAGREVYFKGREKELLSVVDSIFASGYLTADGQGISDTIKTITDAGFVYEIESD